MDALVTGGAGFIGSSVAEMLLESGHDVTILDNLSSGFKESIDPLPRCRFVEGDIRDADLVAAACQRAEVVFHLGASVGNKRSIDDPQTDAEVNLLGTVNVLEGSRRAHVKKVVLSSSAGVLGEVHQLPIPEDHPTNPISPYGVTKLAAEKMALVYRGLYDLDVACLRYFNVYGPGQRLDAYGNVIPIFVFRLLAGEPLTVYGDGEQTRDFVYVTDVARANILAATTADASGVFNVASGTSVSINQLIAILGEVSGIPPEVEYTEPRQGDVRDSRADVSRAGEAMGFQPSVDIWRGLTEYLRWARERVE